MVWKMMASGSSIKALVHVRAKEKRRRLVQTAALYLGGAGRDRTDDLLHAMQALSQLSYGPKFVSPPPDKQVISS